jgi:hypothetical protein
MFKAWLLLQEDAQQASVESNNAEFSNLLGVRKNWFGILMAQARKFVRGGDDTTVALMAANHLIMSLRNPSDKLAQAMLGTRGDEGATTALFTKAAYLRVRRFAAEFIAGQYNKKTVNMSSLERKQGGNFGYGKEFADTHRPDENDRLERLKAKILAELRQMAEENPRSAERFRLAIQVAPARLENAPEMTGMDELMVRFPHIKKTNMFKIIQDIGNAYARVAAKSGDEALQAAIAKRRG